MHLSGGPEASWEKQKTLGLPVPHLDPRMKRLYPKTMLISRQEGKLPMKAGVMRRTLCPGGQQAVKADGPTPRALRKTASGSGHFTQVWQWLQPTSHIDESRVPETVND